MNKTHILIIIYLPNGEEVKYCNKNIGKDYTLAETIERDPGIVRIGLKQDSKFIWHNYTGMPYYLEMF